MKVIFHIFWAKMGFRKTLRMNWLELLFDNFYRMWRSRTDNDRWQICCFQTKKYIWLFLINITEKLTEWEFWKFWNAELRGPIRLLRIRITSVQNGRSSDIKMSFPNLARKWTVFEFKTGQSINFHSLESILNVCLYWIGIL